MGDDTSKHRGPQPVKNDDESLGLRELKRRATENAIENTAVDIALAEGIDAVTVERVCSDVFISRSTFFNYFPTRDSAIFGKPLVIEPSEGLDVLLHDWADDLPIGLALAVFEAIGTSRMNSDVARKRMRLIAGNPELIDRVKGEIFGFRSGLETIVEDWLRRNPEHLRLGNARADAVMAVKVASLLADEVYELAMQREGDLEVDIDALFEVYARVRAGLAAYAT